MRASVFASIVISGVLTITFVFANSAFAAAKPAKKKNVTTWPTEVITSTRWPKKWAIVDYRSSNGARHSDVLLETHMRVQWAEVNALLAKQTGRKSVSVSPEYITYRSGATELFGPAGYRISPKNISSKFDDVKEPKTWLTLIQPRDANEANCMALGVVDGKVVGCGDEFQGGITSSKVACFEGKTYLKCHLDCIATLYSRQLDTTPGACGKTK